jgi:hypothetical protein
MTIEDAPMGSFGLSTYQGNVAPDQLAAIRDSAWFDAPLVRPEVYNPGATGETPVEHQLVEHLGELSIGSQSELVLVDAA